MQINNISVGETRCIEIKTVPGAEAPRFIPSCHSLNVSSYASNQPLFDVDIDCVVTKLELSISGIDCGTEVTYGPDIDGIRLVEMHRSDVMECHVPLITKVNVGNKCKVTFEYPFENMRGTVLLRALRRQNANITISLCNEDLRYVC